ncbi:hypothetical protein ACROYT_G042366 [Oculina patagonica]
MVYQHTFLSRKTLHVTVDSVIIQLMRILWKLCSSAANSVETADTEEPNPDPPAHLLQSRGMGTQVMEEHIPVHPEVAEILRNSRGQVVDGKWHKPLYNARKLAKLRNEYIAKGYYWPEKPMADRGLDRTPKGHKRVMLQEERRKKIEENMAKMPQIVEEYKKRMREKRAKQREEKEKARLQGIQAQRLGYDIRDPRALLAIQGETKDDKKKKKANK